MSSKINTNVEYLTVKPVYLTHKVDLKKTMDRLASKMKTIEPDSLSKQSYIPENKL